MGSLTFDAYFFDMIHSSIEASGIVVAVICALLARSLFKIKDQLVVAVLGMIMVVSCMVDLVDLLSSGVVIFGISSEKLEWLAWSVSRIFNAGIYLAGGLLILGRNKKGFGNNTTGFVLGASAILVFIFALAFHFLLKLEYYFTHSLLSVRPWDVLILSLYLIGFGLFLRIYKKDPCDFSTAILYSFVPNILAQLLMGFGVFYFLDMAFFIAHILKVMGYSFLLFGIQKELVVAYASLEIQKQAVEKISQYKTEFIANVSHEIRTPIHGILGHFLF